MASPNASSASGDLEFIKHPSRRSVVHGTKGIVACSQPLAAKCGIEVLEKGGNAADAAVAVGMVCFSLPFCCCPLLFREDES